MPNIKRAATSGITKSGTAIPDVPDAPTIGTATDVGTSRAYNNGAATVAYTAAVTGGAVTTFTATSSPGGFTATGSSPITVTGLQSATAYTFTVRGANATATGAASAASSSITATTVPQAPTIGTFTDGGTGTTGTLSFTAGATGGSSITGYKYSTDGSTYTSASGTASPLSLTGLTAGTYTFTLKATNANGDSAASSGVSGTVIQPTNYEYIGTVSGYASSYTFSGLSSSSYKSFQIRGIARSAGGSDSVFFYFNGDTGNNYTYQFMQTYGNTYVGNAVDAITVPIMRAGVSAYNTSTSSYYGQTIIDIFDPGSTSKNKTVSVLSGYETKTNDQGLMFIAGGVWRSTAAISSITLYLGNSTDFDSNSRFDLYGVS